jgi:hypothetical protein
VSAGSAEHGAVALRFAHALTTGTFDLAHSLLTPTLGRDLSIDELKASYEHMIEYGEGPAQDAQLITTLEQWPDKTPGDLGWAYVAIIGTNYSEAVTVVVTDQRLIRAIEWGRP